MATNRSLALLYASSIGHARNATELRKAVNLFLQYAKGGTRERLMKQFNISKETIAAYLPKTIETKFGEMQPTYSGKYGELAGVMGELKETYPGKAEDVLGMGFEHLRYANIGEDFPVYKPGSIAELERHAGQHRGENYYEYAQRLAQAGYRPPQGAASPGALPWQIQHTRNIMRGLGQDETQLLAQTPTPTPTPTAIPQQPGLMKFTTPVAPTMAQPTPTTPTPQPTQMPSISLTPATPEQPVYQPTPTTGYQSTYYQANGYKPYKPQDTFGDKPFSYAYQRPRLYQSYTGI